MTTLFTNARLIDPEAGTDAPGGLIVSQGRITAVFPGGAEAAHELPGHGLSPDEVTEVDCGGKCLAPGIVDIGV